MVLVTARQAADVLGVKIDSVYALASAGLIARRSPLHARGQAYDLDQLEQRSLALLKYNSTGHPYWLNVIEIADYLGVGRSRVRQLMEAERLPYVTAPNGRRYVRQHQLEVIANARDFRAG